MIPDPSTEDGMAEIQRRIKNDRKKPRKFANERKMTLMMRLVES